MKFGYKHYVPILKTKAGERWALSMLKATTLKHVTPLLELHPHKTHSVAVHVDGLFESLVSAWGTDRPFFLDTRYVQDGSASIIKVVFSAARAAGLIAVPVIATTNTNDETSALASVIEKDDRGCMVRALRQDFSSVSSFANRVDPLLVSTGVSRNISHLMIDYRSVAMSLATNVPNVSQLSEWLTFTASSGAFPRSVNDLDTANWWSLDRTDWQSWLSGIGSGLARKPSFSDYVIKDTSAPAGGGSPLVNIRYTHDDEWLVRRDGKLRDGMAYKMHTICSELIARAEYSGVAFSKGDRCISECASRTIGQGNPQSWLQWGMNHHIEYVVKQLKSI